MKTPRLLIFDARVIVFVALLVFHLRVWTALLLVAGLMVFWLIERAGLRFPSALRALRSRIAGRQRPARAAHLYRSTIDFGFEGHPLIKPSAAQRSFASRQAKVAAQAIAAERGLKKQPKDRTVKRRARKAVIRKPNIAPAPLPAE
ncbi:IcmT/TraK family protein [Aurantimonas sp. C2-6-R+9]|nr:MULTISPECIES: IcmT/TraK family protein [unclassified Aurantimonas]MEC5291945.1 IcmT/TraK family protein [Aurantimonas sp. C2-3-R2]MEC5383242.1 IcmT/TraK family protein [Aurantimonas sp. C2-6-R+9]MEC5413031.1 IcmT/TraK family protein [Aurantimonas sp. C2-4-R8]